MVRLRVIEEYAHENNIPIMMSDGIEFLTDYIKKNKVKRILEIGSAIGYSAIRMALVDDDINVVTIERDVLRYNEAVKNINDESILADIAEKEARIRRVGNSKPRCPHCGSYNITQEYVFEDIPCRDCLDCNRRIFI